jgi:hypothetical protein
MATYTTLKRIIEVDQETNDVRNTLLEWLRNNTDDPRFNYIVKQISRPEDEWLQQMDEIEAKLDGDRT